MSSIFSDFGKQFVCLQEALTMSTSLKEKCLKMECEKNEALEKCAELSAKIERLSKEKCVNCTVLINKLNKEKKEKETVKKEAKAKLLKTIAKTLENMDDGNTNHVASAQEFFTQLMYNGIDHSPETKEKAHITLIEHSDDSEDESKILVNETVVGDESDGSSNHYISKFGASVVVPETEAVNTILAVSFKNRNQNCKNHGNLAKSPNSVNEITNLILKENSVSSEEEVKIQPISKKLKLSPILSSSMNVRDGSPSRCHSPLRSLKGDSNVTVTKEPIKSLSVLSENFETVGGSSNLSIICRSSGVSSNQEGKGTTWKMKPTVLVDNNINAPSGKKLKQMTLSLARTEKKHDISLSEGFKGGVTKSHTKQIDDERDMILPSPENLSKRMFCNNSGETMEDPDMTIFNPGVTSTCLPVDTSFDRIPDVPKSPPYKYRRDTVRKKKERKKLPGQDCDKCARYYEAAGLDKTQEIRARMNVCSRHRDKYPIRANTPPGFWDPVLPVTPEGSQETRE